MNEFKRDTAFCEEDDNAFKGIVWAFAISLPIYVLAGLYIYFTWESK